MGSMTANKMLDIARYEYLRHVTRSRFWIALIGIPLGFLLVFLLSAYISYASVNKAPVGYVDQAGLITLPQTEAEDLGLFEFQIKLVPFADEAAARSAAQRKEIQGYFSIPAHFESTYRLAYYSDEMPVEEIQKEIKSLISKNLLAGEVLPNADRLIEGSTITLESLDGQTQLGQNAWTRILIPVVTSLLFTFVMMSSGGYLMRALVEEKENRTMEMMVTSVSPAQLMTGKVLGNMSVGLTELVFQILLVGAVLIFFRDQLPFLSEISISWENLLISLAIMLPALILISSLMATLGATVTDTRESEPLIGILVVPMMVPFYFITVFMSTPNGLIARILSYFPLSAPIAVSLRMAFTQVPGWELVLIFLVLTAFAVASLWLSGKAFRLGMLQYTQRIPLAQLFRREAKNE